MINNPIIYKIFKDFTNHRKKTNRAVVFSCRPFPNILKYRDHRWNFPTIWKTRLLKTLSLKSLSLYVYLCMYISWCTSLYVYISLYIYLFMYVSLCISPLFMYISVCISFYVYISMYISLYISLCIPLYVWYLFFIPLYVYPWMYISLCMSLNVYLLL